MRENLQHSHIKVKHKVEKFSRVSRDFLKNHLKMLAGLHSQAKDGKTKAFLRDIGATCSRHINKNHLKTTEKRPKRNFIQIDHDLFTCDLRANEKLVLLMLCSFACREGEKKALILSTAELKNFLSKAYGKSFLKRTVGELIKKGLIEVRRVGRYEWDGHRYSKIMIEIKSFFVRFKTVATIYNIPSIDDDEYLKKPLEEALPPPIGDFFNFSFISEELLAKGGESYDFSTEETQQEKEGILLHLDEICSFWAKKSKILAQERAKKHQKRVEKAKRWEKIKLSKAIKSAFERWPTLQSLGFNEYNRVKNFQNLQEFLSDYRWKNPTIRNPLAAFIADVRSGKMIMWDNFLGAYDEKTEKRSPVITQSRTEGIKGTGLKPLALTFADEICLRLGLN